MDAVEIRKALMYCELNAEYELLRRDMNHVVQEGFQELLGPYKRLHISNIPFSFRESDLIDLFKPFGPVFGAEIIFNERGSKGFGFLTMFKKDAEIAFAALNHMSINGRRVEINDATPRKSNFKTPQKNDRRVTERSTQTTPNFQSSSTFDEFLLTPFYGSLPCNGNFSQTQSRRKLFFEHNRQ